MPYGNVAINLKRIIKEKEHTFPQNAMYFERSLSIFSCSHFLRIFILSSLTELAGSFPTIEKKLYYHEIMFI